MGERSKYHLTIRDRAGMPPCHAIVLGGLEGRTSAEQPRPTGNLRAVEFRRVTQVLGLTADDPTVTYPGAVGLYSEEEIAAYRAAVQHHVVRWRWSREQDREPRLVAAEVHDTRCVGFESDVEDEPLEGYLVIRPLADPLAPIAGDPVEAEALAQAQQAELIAQQTDGADARRRARHARAKMTGERIDPN